MLAYTFHFTNKTYYKKLQDESFENGTDMYAKILSLSVTSLIKRGLGKKYIEQTYQSSNFSGKLQISDSVKRNTLMRKEIIYTKDDFSINSEMNQIIKTSMELLIKSKDVQKQTKHDLKKLLIYFSDVDTFELRSIRWNSIVYNKNNFTYKLIVNICYLIYKASIQTQKEGKSSYLNFMDDRALHTIFERFVLKYYQKHFPLYKTSSKQIKWNVFGDDELLPKMQSDIYVEAQDKCMIIDTKLYSRMLKKNSQYDTESQHSNNLYQIFTYVKNEQGLNKKEIVGMLLYARVEEGRLPDKTYNLDNSTIHVRSIDLDRNFSDIKNTLNDYLDSVIQFRSVS